MIKHNPSEYRSRKGQIEPKPFVKWAGGKSQLLPKLNMYRPECYKRYLEPFVGGGALLFSLRPDQALINDSNEELINTYMAVKNSPEELIEDLKRHKNDETYYYNIRGMKTSEMTNIERASRFVYLNRTCFNGLWRVNKKNEFNTPYGYYKNPRIVNADMIRAVSSFLGSIDINCMDYREFLEKNAHEEDFVYLDPPYHPISKYSDFKRYTKEFFGEKEQIELADVIGELTRRGCKIMLSNSYSKLVLDLYSDYEIITVKARRNINKDPNGRAAIDEVLVRNYG
ncbi:MAG: DNA adenine methylase [Candidatus Thorarchaeota archaeon]|nr:MAG: DNA adenine methylase [Candidatus Thorarchaeota archaeon]